MHANDEPQVTLALAQAHGLNEEEYARILSILGREPSWTELGIFSVMWSEHCSYKNSILQLKTLPTEGKRVLAGAGEENAGAVDMGDGIAVVFKIESHNHPSAVEPYQGAATGVGGILRDIFTMGARPIAALNSLRFGSLEDPRVRYLFNGVVKGIGDYGNCFGVPTVGGEVVFDPCYTDNPLVNAMAVGILEGETMARATAKGIGNPVMVVGSSTGRDGIHGATFASRNLDEDSEASRPNVQVGDPFTEKLLLEATLEVLRTGFVVGIQDMGAAGLTCSSSETAAKGKVGMELDIDLVPVRETGMTPYEIMLSESQERMLLIVEKGHEADVRAVFEKWDLHCVTIGTITADEMLRVKSKGQVVAEIPADVLVLGGGAPQYVRERRIPSYFEGLRAFDPLTLPPPKDLKASALKLLASPSISSKRWVYRQYDHMVRTNTVVYPGSDAAVLRIKKSPRGIAVSTDCNGRYCYLDPYEGAKAAVAESARNVACVGATPTAITNCLNFGNPYDPEVYWCFTEAIRGMGDACKAFETPVTGGNVSFYNRSDDYSVYPTPTIGMLGILEQVDRYATHWFKEPDDVLILLGPWGIELGGSEYLAVEYGKIAGMPPRVDLDLERKVQRFLVDAIAGGWIKSAHDLAEGGLWVALCECCWHDHGPHLGAIVELPREGRADHLLFSETQGRVLLSVEPSEVVDCLRKAREMGIPAKAIGQVRTEAIEIAGQFSVPTAEAFAAWSETIEKAMSR